MELVASQSSPSVRKTHGISGFTIITFSEEDIELVASQSSPSVRKTHIISGFTIITFSQEDTWN